MTKTQQYALNWALQKLEEDFLEVARDCKDNPKKLESLEIYLKVRVGFFKDRLNEIIHEK